MEKLELYVDKTDRIDKVGETNMDNIKEVYVNENLIRITFINGNVLYRNINGYTLKITNN